MVRMNKLPFSRSVGAFARVLAVVLSLTGFSLALTGCDQAAAPVGGAAKTASFKAMDISEAGYAHVLKLPDVDGKLRSLDEFKGKVVFVFFGFTQCPDVCPTTMATLAEVRRRLGPDGARLQGIFVSIDPERDTPEVLKAYVHAMDDSFIGLRGDAEQTREAATEFKIYYQKVPTKDGKSYTMDHTAGAYIFDTQGRVRLFSRYGESADALTGDIRQLLAEAAAVPVKP